MSQHADEEFDQDLLLEFSTEPGPTPTTASGLAELGQPAANVEVAALDATSPTSLELIESLNTRVRRLEQTLGESASQIASLKSVVATLVSTIDDNKTMKRPPAKAAPLPPSALVSKPRRSAVSAIAVAVLGIALGAFAWSMWPRESIQTIAAASAPVIEQQPAAPDPPPANPPQTDPLPAAPQREAVLPSAPAPAREVPVRAVPATLQLSTPVAYVGTLSIDSAPGGEVFINRQAAGRTPLRVADLKAGSHLVWIERDGYRRWTQVVQVRSGHVNRVSASLERLAAP